MRSPGFLNELQQQLESLSLEELDRMNRQGGLEVSDLLNIILKPQDYTVEPLYPIDPKNIVKSSDIPIKTFWEGLRLLNSQEVAICVVVNSDSLKNVPGHDRKMLGLCISKLRSPRLLVLTPPEVKKEVQDIINSESLDVKAVENYECLGLTPGNNLDLNEGRPVYVSCGTGDLIPALKRDGLWSSLKTEGVKHVIVTSGDNYCSSSSMALVLGQHAVSGSPVSHVVVKSKASDNQGILCEHSGIDQVVERHRVNVIDMTLDLHSSADTLVFNTDLDFDYPSKWHRVKKVHNDRLIVSYERSIYDLTAKFKTQFIELDRNYGYVPLRELLQR